jgi:phage virion morphogenesis protein
MAHDLTPLIKTVDALLQNLSTAERKTLATDIARQLRSSQAGRIKDNINPDGTPHQPRKPQRLRNRAGSIRRRMFQKLIRTRWLKASSTANEATVGFVGFADQVAKEHHYGLRTRIGKKQVQMPERQLLGLTAAELQLIEDLTIKHLAL